MKTFTTYDVGTGFITGHYSGKEAPQPDKSIEGHYCPKSFVVRGGSVVPVPLWEPKVSSNRIAGIPQGSRVTWGGGENDTAIVSDGEVTFDLVGKQTRQVEITAPGCPPYWEEVCA